MAAGHEDQKVDLDSLFSELFLLSQIPETKTDKKRQERILTLLQEIKANTKIIAKGFDIIFKPK